MAEAYIICRELGIELVEAVAVNTSEVAEAVRSLIGQRVEAIWIGGDTVAMSSIHMIISLAKQAGIPVFTNVLDTPTVSDSMETILLGITGGATRINILGWPWHWPMGWWHFRVRCWHSTRVLPMYRWASG